MIRDALHAEWLLAFPLSVAASHSCLLWCSSPELLHVAGCMLDLDHSMHILRLIRAEPQKRGKPSLNTSICTGMHADLGHPACRITMEAPRTRVQDQAHHPHRHLRCQAPPRLLQAPALEAAPTAQTPLPTPLTPANSRYGLQLICSGDVSKVAINSLPKLQ